MTGSRFAIFPPAILSSIAELSAHSARTPYEIPPSEIAAPVLANGSDLPRPYRATPLFYYGCTESDGCVPSPP